jgi:hypothetical protein
LPARASLALFGNFAHSMSAFKAKHGQKVEMPSRRELLKQLPKHEVKANSQAISGK